MPSFTDKTPSNSRLEWVGLWLMLAITCITRLPFYGHPAADFDEQLYNLIGSHLWQGELPYVDLWDRKPFGLFAIYALAHGIGGPIFGADSPLPYQILATLFCLAGGWQTYALARRMVDGTTAALAACLYPVMMALFDSHSGQSEIFFTPLMLAMAQLLLAAQSSADITRARRLCVTAMAIGGMALQIKYTVLPQCLFFGVISLAILRKHGAKPRRLIGDASIFAILGLLPTAIIAAYYAHNGSINAFLFANFQSIGLRTAMPLRITWFDQLVFAIPILALAGGGALYSLHIRAAPTSPLWRWAMLWLALSIAGMFMGSTVYPYYYAALVPPAILCALPMFDRRHNLGMVIWMVVLLGMLIGFNPPARMAATGQERAQLAKISHRLKVFIGHNSHCLYVFDGPLVLYQLTNSPLPTRIIYPDHLNNALEMRALPVNPASEVSRILQQRPGAIVTSLAPVTVQNMQTNALIKNELSAHYRMIETIMFQSRRLQLFARLPDADGISPKCDSSL
jgi:Dolichyl-phosphate-mannose-protein mannosyltransferase